MDPWAELSNRLVDPLGAENDLALALANAADAPAACPDASAAKIKDSLAHVVGLTSDMRILDLASRVQRRLGKLSQLSTKRETAFRSAQEADRDDVEVDWWRGFVSAAVAKLPPRRNGDECERLSYMQPTHLTRAQPEVQADGGTDRRSGLEEFVPLPPPKRIKREDGASNLETFIPRRTKSSRTASGTWSPGRNCGKLVRRGRHGGSIGPQAQVLLTNAYRNCETLPREARAALRGHIKPIGGLRRSVTFAAKMTSWLCGVAAKTVQNAVVHVDARGPSKRPCLKRRAGVASAAAGAAAAGGCLSPLSEEGDDAGSSDGAERGASADVADDQRDGELADGSRSTQLPGFGNLLRINALVSPNGLGESQSSVVHEHYPSVHAKRRVAASVVLEHCPSVNAKLPLAEHSPSVHVLPSTSVERGEN